MESVVESLEETVLEVHITDWVNAIWEVDTSWELTVSVGPVVLDTLHVELVANDHDLLGRRSVDLSEKVFVTLINKDLLQSWEEESGRLDIPVDQVLVETSLSELVWLGVVHSAGDFRSLASPESVALIGESLPQVLRKVHSSLVVEPAPGLLIELWTQELKLGTAFLCFFTGKFDFETWLQESVVTWDPEVEFEAGHIGVVSKPEDWSSRWVPVVALK